MIVRNRANAISCTACRSRKRCTQSDRSSNAIKRLNLSGDTGLGVGNLDTELLSASDNLDTLAGGDGVGDLSGESLVVHEEEVDIADVVDEEGLVSRWHHVLGLLVGTESDLH